ncbi:MAG: PAS domain S-box protein [Proteobacteria bacterium]|nr:PAS domain S-box protein [Desulfobacula sp.]MBU3951086.1 PAS domain S-box protein [Pseudomonadota bacterium]MBU4132356.1 PAS domain S-box protein [Pseudomonadota bacterium]
MAEKPSYEALEKKIQELEQAASDRNAIEDALKASEKTHRTLIEEVQDLFYRTDLDGRITFISPSVYALSGYTMEEAIGIEMAPKIYVRPEERKLFLKALQENGSVHNFEAQLKRKDGSLWQASTNAHFYKDKNGTILGVEGITRDVTERHRAEEINNVLFAISTAVNTTRNLSDLYPSIHASLSRIIDVTNFFIAIVDQKEQTLYFPYHMDTEDDDFLPITPFNTENSLTGLVVSQRRPLLLEKKALEDRAGRNGVWGPVPVIWMGVPLIIRDQVIGVMAVQSYLNPHLYTKHDLQILSAVSDQVALAIDRKRGEEMILASEKRFREIIEDVSEISIQGYDEKRRIIFWNHASENLYGYTRKEALGKKIEDLIIPKGMREQVILLHHRWVEFGEKIPAGELILKNKKGEDVPVFSSHVMRDSLNGQEMFCIDIDLAPLKQAQRDKILAQKIAGEHEKMALIGQIAGKMAHDFNNILGIIMGNAELSLMTCREAETAKTLELIFEQTLRGKNLTRNLVAFAKEKEPKRDFFQLSEKIDLVTGLLKSDLAGIELTREDSPGIPDLLADPGMIEHALVNLLQNSIHAVSTHKSPRIKMKTHALDDTLCIEITDNGCGIPPEDIENIYEPSFTLKGGKDMTGSYRTDIKGTGYGMSNVKKYIDLHQGSISVESRLGSGTKFTLHLPVIKKQEIHTKKNHLPKTHAPTQKHILIVEDEPAISEVQCKLLSQGPGNHRVDIAETGQAAMALLKKNNYDLLSLDYVLHGNTNGMDVYKYARQTNKTAPILFISGNIDFLESIKRLKMQDPHIDHLPKPCQNIEYITLINELLQRNLTVQ